MVPTGAPGSPGSDSGTHRTPVLAPVSGSYTLWPVPVKQYHVTRSHNRYPDGFGSLLAAGELTGTVEADDPVIMVRGTGQGYRPWRCRGRLGPKFGLLWGLDFK